MHNGRSFVREKVWQSWLVWPGNVCSWMWWLHTLHTYIRDNCHCRVQLLSTSMTIWLAPKQTERQRRKNKNARVQLKFVNHVKNFWELRSGITYRICNLITTTYVHALTLSLTHTYIRVPVQSQQIPNVFLCHVLLCILFSKLDFNRRKFTLKPCLP